MEPPDPRKPARSTLLYLANMRVPTEKAHGFQIFKMCEAFAGEGFDVELWHPRRRNIPEMTRITDVFDHYHVRTRFPLQELPCWDSPGLKALSARPWAVAHALSFLMSVLTRLRARTDAQTILYSRDLWIAWRLGAWKRKGVLRNPVFFEAHTLPEGPRRLFLRSLRHLDGLVVLTHLLRQRLLAAGVARERVLVAPDGVDLDAYRDLPPRDQARLVLGLPEGPLVVYTGHFYPWKGVDLLVESSGLLPGVHVLLVGGTAQDQERIREKVRGMRLDNVILAGWVPPKSVPLYQAAADVLVLPNSARMTISREHTSPLKLFEYMAAGRPVVASKLPSTSEVLAHERNALLVDCDNPRALAEGIRRLLCDPVLASFLARQAMEDAERYSWSARARSITRAMEGSPS